MKTAIRNIPMLLVCLLFTSCGNPVSKEFIETSKDENARYRVIGEEMQASGRSNSANQEKQYQAAIAKIDPAKRKAFDKDVQLKEKISANRNSLKELNATYAMLSDSLVWQTAENEKLISMFLEKKTDKKEAAQKWEVAKNKARKFQESSESVMHKIEEKEKDLSQMYDVVDGKYGKKAKPVSKKKKKR